MATPTGTVTITDTDGIQIGTGTLDGNGNMNITVDTTNLAVGTHSLVWSYSGDSQDNPSSQTILALTVTSLHNTQIQGQTVTPSTVAQGGQVALTCSVVQTS